MTWPTDSRGKPMRRMSYRAWLELQGKPVPNDTTNLYRRYDGRFEVGLRDAGATLHWYTAETVGEAKAIRDAKRVKRTAGEAEPTNRAQSFNEAATAYEAGLARRQNTANAYAAALIHLRAAFGPRKLQAIGPADVKAYIADRVRDDKLAGWTLRGHRTVLSGVFKAAGLASPTKQLAPADWPETATGGMRILNDAQLGHLIGGAPDDVRLYLATLAQTGMRKSEALGLTPADLREGAIRVERQRDRYTGGRAPQKNSRQRHAARDVTVSHGLIMSLRRHILEEGIGEHAFIFAALDYHRVDHAWTTARRRARLDGITIDGEVIEPAMRLHDLRHGHVSSLIAEGWDAARIAARIGDSIGTVLGTYAHIFDSARHAEDERASFAARYDNLTTNAA